MYYHSKEYDFLLHEVQIYAMYLVLLDNLMLNHLIHYMFFENQSVIKKMTKNEKKKKRVYHEENEKSDICKIDSVINISW